MTVRRGLWGAGVLLGALSSSSAQAATHILAVGNDTGDPREVTLRFAERDATRFVDVMTALGGADDAKVDLLLSKNADDVREAMERLETRLKMEEDARGDSVIIYYSGHADAEKLHLGGSHLAFAELKTWLDTLPAQVRVLILDSCRSGGITRAKGAEPAPAFAIRLEDRLDVSGVAIITSSAQSEDSQESDDLEGSFFTHHLITGLKGAADRDRDMKVTLNEAYAYAYRETLRSTGRTLHVQHPTYAYEIEGRGELVFTRLDRGAGSGTLALGQSGQYRVFDLNGHLVAEVGVEDEGANFLLSPGQYAVERYDASEVMRYDIDLARGETVDLMTLQGTPDSVSAFRGKGGRVDVFHRFDLRGGASSGIVPGYGVGPSVALGYSADTRWGFMLGTDLTWSQSESLENMGDTTALGLRLRFEVPWRLGDWRLSPGLLGEVAWTMQSFDNPEIQDPASFSGTLGGVAAVEYKLTDQLGLRMETGLGARMYRQAGIEEGEPESVGLTPAWWTALGLTWWL